MISEPEAKVILTRPFEITCEVTVNYAWFNRIVAIIAVSAFTAKAKEKVWSVNSKRIADIVTDRAVSSPSFPKEFKLFDLNIEPLRRELSSIVDANAASALISLPNADGRLELFEVFEASNFEPDLQAKFPAIGAF